MACAQSSTSSAPSSKTATPRLQRSYLRWPTRFYPWSRDSWLDDWGPGPGGDAQEPSSDPAVATAVERIHAEPERAWTVTSLAREAALSRSAFARRFALAVGEPPGAYLAHWRMTIAGRLLRDSDLNLAAVARRVGYASEFAFAKAFKRDYGMAPGAYRRQLAA